MIRSVSTIGARAQEIRSSWRANLDGEADHMSGLSACGRGTVSRINLENPKMARKAKPVTEIARQAKWIADTLLPRTTSVTAAEVVSLPFIAPIAERYGISPDTLASGAAFYHRVKQETGEEVEV